MLSLLRIILQELLIIALYNHNFIYILLKLIIYYLSVSFIIVRVLFDFVIAGVDKDSHSLSSYLLTYSICIVYI